MERKELAIFVIACYLMLDSYLMPRLVLHFGKHQSPEKPPLSETCTRSVILDQ